MKFTTAVLVSAAAALTSATAPDYDPTTGKWTCHVPDAVYCAGDSLKTNIIIRCNGLVGQPGNCNDNLAGEPPVGVQPTLCYAPELHSAACVKNCIVYGGSGNLDGTFPLPADVCTPTEPEPTTTTTGPEPTTTTTEPEPTTTTEPEPTTTTEPEPTTTDEPTTVTETQESTTTTTCDSTTTEPEPTTTTDEPEPTTTVEPTEPPVTDEPTVVPPTTVTITINQCETTPIPPATVSNGTWTPQPTEPNTPVGPSSTPTGPVTPIPNAAGANAASLGMVVLAAAVAFAV
ncbi:hypothetical protein V490_06485 [Pseudogymnoascus sp. VKM F-3557]|nr:hypothetical protein V490_06485 [Pseudogymnoascus sp. VKM F-3557]